MHQETQKRLLEVNRQFYQTFAVEFDATRQRLQPGVQRILELIPRPASMLDLGCGNGELGRALERRGHTGLYLGLDFSPGLLAAARPATEERSAIVDRGSPRHMLTQADLASPGWDGDLRSLPLPPGAPPFDFILSFAVLHHLPGRSLRLQVLRKVHDLLAPKGKFIHSNWQFLNSPRLRERIQPWDKVGISTDQVDAGDYLLDWRRGGAGLRYVHHFTPGELEALANETGFQMVDSFTSDGESGDLGLYQIWELRANETR